MLNDGGTTSSMPFPVQCHVGTLFYYGSAPTRTLLNDNSSTGQTSGASRQTCQCIRSRIPPNLLQGPAFKQAFGAVDIQYADCDFANIRQRYDGYAIKGK